MGITKSLLLCIGVGSILLLGTILSCNKKAKKDFSLIEKKLLDSPDQKYKLEEVTCVYYDSIPVYDSQSEKNLIDYIYLGSRVYTDTIIEPVGNTDPNGGNYDLSFYTGFTYVKLGQLNHGFTRQSNLARQVGFSKTDDGLIFMGNYLSPKGDFCAAEIKAVKENKVVASFVPDDSLITGLYLDLFLMSNIALKDAGEVMYLSTYYPACGYAANDWYLAFKNNQFITLSYTTNWADAPYSVYTTVYLPFKTQKGVVMANWSPYYSDTNGLVTDTNGTIITYQLPDEYVSSIDQMIYHESHRSYEMLDKKGKPVLDEYEESKMGDELYDKRWFKWNGSKAEQIKIDTTRIQFPE